MLMSSNLGVITIFFKYLGPRVDSVVNSIYIVNITGSDRVNDRDSGGLYKLHL